MVCVVVASMPEKDLYIPENAFVIAADRGYAHLSALGIRPDLTVGDFDSLGYVPSGTQIVRHPVQKDDTDMLLAVREGLSAGADTFLLYGGMGGRLDHTIANLQTLNFLCDEGKKAILFGEGLSAMLLKDGEQRFPKSAQGTISVFSFGEKAVGVTETGLEYALSDATVANTFPIGVSNAFCGQESAVSVQKGTLLLLWESTAKEAAEVLLKRD